MLPCLVHDPLPPIPDGGGRLEGSPFRRGDHGCIEEATSGRAGILSRCHSYPDQCQPGVPGHGEAPEDERAPPKHDAYTVPLSHEA